MSVIASIVIYVVQFSEKKVERKGRSARKTAYKVVKFIVNVKLVLNRANNSVGSVIVVKVIVQIRIPGTALSTESSPWPSIASHETASVAVPSGEVDTSAEAWDRMEAVVVCASEDVRLEIFKEAEKEGLIAGGAWTGGGAAWWT